MVDQRQRGELEWDRESHLRTGRVGGRGVGPTSLLGADCLWQLCPASSNSFGAHPSRTRWVPDAEPTLSLEIPQVRLLQMLWDLSKTPQRMTPRRKLRLRSPRPCLSGAPRLGQGEGQCPAPGVGGQTAGRLATPPLRAAENYTSQGSPRRRGAAGGRGPGLGAGPPGSQSEDSGGCPPDAAGAKAGREALAFRREVEGKGTTQGKTEEPQFPSTA